MASLANHPARLAALKAGDKRFKSDTPCKRHGHLWRYVENGMACAECADVNRKGKSNGGAKPVKIDRDDADQDQMRLRRTNEKYLRLLMTEKLEAIRSGALL
jgi:hypothetical protein